MSYATPHSIMRFIERVDIDLPRKKKQRDKLINNYLKKAYNNGTLIHNIKDVQLKSYMLHKLKNDYHTIKANRITLYNNNLFLFINRQCITVLNIPDEIKAQDDVLKAKKALKEEQTLFNRLERNFIAVRKIASLVNLTNTVIDESQKYV